MQIFSLSAGGLQEQTVLLGEIRWLYQCKARGDVYLISDMATSEEEACLSVGAVLWQQGVPRRYQKRDLLLLIPPLHMPAKIPIDIIPYFGAHMLNNIDLSRPG